MGTERGLRDALHPISLSPRDGSTALQSAATAAAGDIAVYSQIRSMHHRIMVQFGQWFRSWPVPSYSPYSLLGKIFRLMVQWFNFSRTKPRNLQVDLTVVGHCPLPSSFCIQDMRGMTPRCAKNWIEVS